MISKYFNEEHCKGHIFMKIIIYRLKMLILSSCMFLYIVVLLHKLCFLVFL